MLGIHEEPRKLIKSTEGYELIEIKGADKCWCMSGAFGVQHSTLSIPVLKQKSDNINNIGAVIVASACSGCMIQIQGGVDQQAPDKKMKHIADILTENIRD
ncbi:MAG: (Fe-S)-binding protein [Deltaproteobacteria bacterium]|nr:(Fe-S)-binding protein [Deltaproteobacteria bacterium]MBN2846501.1 (Fe-S)-binding protein [Deltaproteobacteria bacterium]